MSVTLDNVDQGRSVEDLLFENNLLLKAILLGIEIIADQEDGSLLEDATNEE
jgi:hypothetical protein